jgi:hypothetical protein
MNAAPRAPRRPLAPVVIEEWCTVAVLGVSVFVATAVAAEGDHPAYGVLDAAFAAATAALFAGLLRRRLRHKIAVAPFVPQGAHMDSSRRTIALAVARAPLLVVLVSIGAYDASPAIPIVMALLTAVLAWNAREVQMWEQRTGSRAYRERRVFARGTPIIYRSTSPLTPGSAAPSAQPG